MAELVAGLFIRHNKRHDNINQKPHAKAKERQYKNYSHHGWINVQVVGQTTTHAKNFLFSFCKFLCHG